MPIYFIINPTFDLLQEYVRKEVETAVSVLMKCLLVGENLSRQSVFRDFVRHEPEANERKSSGIVKQSGGLITPCKDTEDVGSIKPVLQITQNVRVIKKV